MIGRAIPSKSLLGAAKKIVLLSDGTGNSSAKAEKTNVWRLFSVLNQIDAKQIAMYDDGVGTSRNKYLAALGGAFGWGLKRNVIHLYKFVCRNYAPGDDIYGFGFSRGSFTIRVVVGLIVSEGLVTFRSEEELNRNAAASYRHYRSAHFPSYSPIVKGMRLLRDSILWLKDRIKGYRSYDQIQADVRKGKRKDIRIKFLGLWDSVEAYGMPIAELKRGIDWVLWPMMFGDLTLSPRVDRACHALSLDDQRTTFHPLLWDEEAEAKMVAEKTVQPGRLTQVWFAGVHSNVGGGYPEDQLSLVSLEWIMNEAIENGLVLDPDMVNQISREQSPYARLYDSRSGLAAYYRYSPRRIPIWTFRKREIRPIIHWSVILRMANGTDRYAPISLPPEFWVLAPDGKLLPMQGFSRPLMLDSTKVTAFAATRFGKAKPDIDAAKAEVVSAIERLQRPDQEVVSLVWDTVWWRRIFYNITVAFTVIVATYPWIGSTVINGLYTLLAKIPYFGADLSGQFLTTTQKIDASSYGAVETVLGAASAFIPGYATPWINVLRESPSVISVLLVSIFVCLYVSKLLQMRICDRARLAWHDGSVQPDYREWLRESQKGWRTGMLLALGASVALLVLSILLDATTQTRNELIAACLIFLVLLAWRFGEKHKYGSSDGEPAQSALPNTFALSLARKVRKNKTWNTLRRWIFGDAIPILFAVGLIVSGLYLLNRALFDAASATGLYCKVGVSSGGKTFRTGELCWPYDDRAADKLVAVKGQRYRITLAMDEDWFDRTLKTDFGGLPTSGWKHIVGAPLKRWWGQNWFKPILRIGAVGNDEYALDPVVAFDSYTYCEEPGKFGRAGKPIDSNRAAGAVDPQIEACVKCEQIEPKAITESNFSKINKESYEFMKACSPTPPSRRTMVVEITARTSGSFFLYVNDAVLMIPGLTDLFYRNNSGAASVNIEKIVATPN